MQFPDSDKNTPNKPQTPGKQPQPRSPWAVFAAFLLVAALLWTWFWNPQDKAGDVKMMSFAEFREFASSNTASLVVKRVRDMESGSSYIVGGLRVKDGAKSGDSASGPVPAGLFADGGGDDRLSAPFRVNLIPGENENLNRFLDEHGISCPVEERKPSLFGPILREIVMFGLFFLVFWFIFLRPMRGGGGPFGAGKSRAKLLEKESRKTTFADVAGVDEAREEVQEIIEFLKNPGKFRALGGRIPKGVLLVGPPGTGKTLLAKAIAGEANVPFFSISGSDFVEMFVGVGASRVRDMFDQAKKHKPCIVFIDEIDAVGQRRSSAGGYLSGSHSEQEQTLNAMLVEMDGFETNDGVIIVAATNRPDVLDPALLRPGRFDRQIMIDLPSLKGREKILELHSKKIKFAPDADLKRIARGTPGFSGADLANLLNEAALLAARKSLDGVTHAVLEEARDKVMWGRERRSMALSKKDRETTAWHESGHALLQLLLPNTDPLHKVTIIPRGRALGATMSLPDHDVHNRTRDQFLDELAVLTGGRIAEEFFTGAVSTGASADIAQATQLARNMVCRWGMSEKFGFQALLEPPQFSGEYMPPPFSPDTARAIDEEVRNMIDGAYARGRQILEENRDKLEKLAAALIEKETIDGRDAAALLGIEPRKEEEPDEEDGRESPADGAREIPADDPQEDAAK